MSDVEASAAGNPRAVDRVLVVAEREFRTVLRTPLYALLAAGFLAIVGAIAVVGTGGRGGYVPLTLDLLTPMEVLVPVLAFAVGYRSILDDEERGELEVIRTYSPTRPAYVLGVYLGRAATLLPLVVVATAGAGLLVPVLAGPRPTFIATHATADSFLLYLRFVVLTAVFALVVLGVAVAVSAVARSSREALALVVAVFLALVVGFDLGIVAGLAGGAVPEDALTPLLAVSPNSAYRGLVLESVVEVVTTHQVRATAAPLANLLGLVGWLGGSLAVATRSVWTRS